MNTIKKIVTFSLFVILLALSNSHVYADSSRIVENRSPQPWKDLVAERQRQFQENPQARTFRKTQILQRQDFVTVHSHNEADPVEGMITEWWCSSNGNADYWDDMWMAIIAETVHANAEAYVYLYSYLGDDSATTLAVCADMLYQKEGISAEQIRWIQDYETDAFWLRDFGPFFVSDFNYRNLSIEDTLYYPSRPFDDAQPKDFAARYQYPINDLNLYYEGGNFLPNGTGICIASSTLLDANPHYTEAEIRQLFDQRLGCTHLSIVQALDDAATGHVDMWLAWADRTTLLVGEYTEKQDSVNRAIIENNVNAQLSNLVDPDTGLPIKIIRVPMPSNCPPTYALTGKGEYVFPPKVPQGCGQMPPHKRIWRTYLNVTLINNRVVLPVYIQDKTYENEVIAIWENLGYEVRPVVADHISPYQGQFHCVTKTFPLL